MCKQEIYILSGGSYWNDYENILKGLKAGNPSLDKFSRHCMCNFR